MHSRFEYLKKRIIELRTEGLSYTQINDCLGVIVPQSTLSDWCTKVRLSDEAQAILKKRMAGDDYRKAVVSLMAKQKRQRRREAVYAESAGLIRLMTQKDAAKIALAMLYLGEGAKDDRKVVQFGNSNPGIIKLFLKLLSGAYELDVAKFRVRVQCRADQDIKELERFWSEAINIPEIRFYPTWKDQRTAGKPTKKPNYKGVCCITYLDNRIQFELVNLGTALCT